MTGRAGGSVDNQLHVEDCPGCKADLLTDSDRDHLVSNGWTPPAHRFVPPPELAPPPPMFTDGQVAAFWILVTLAWLTLLINARWWCLGITVAVVVTFVWRWWAHRTHLATGRPSGRCGNCKRLWRREAQRRWDDYRRLLAKQKRQRDASYYERLREDERRWRPET